MSDPRAIRHPLSWLQHSQLVADGAVEYWSMPNPPPVERQGDDIKHVVSAGERMADLSQRYYRDPRLDWLIAHANGLMDFVVDMIPGRELIIPAPRYVFTTYLRRRR